MHVQTATRRCLEGWCDGDRRVFVTTARPAVVSVAAAAFVVLSDAGQADKAALRSIRNRVTGVGGTPPPPPTPILGGVGATLLTAWPRGKDSVWWWHRGTHRAWEET